MLAVELRVSPPFLLGEGAVAGILVEGLLHKVERLALFVHFDGSELGSSLHGRSEIQLGLSHFISIIKFK